MTEMPAVPIGIDPDLIAFTNYGPVSDELTEFNLTVEGAIPPELDGWYLRNGPNPREPGGHLFYGDGMVHGLRIEGGKAAWYRNRWVRTESFQKEFEWFRNDGSRDIRASVANTHVVSHAGKTLCLAETSLPYQITNDLETVGAYDFGGKLKDAMTAHPKICPTTGELHFFSYGSLVAPHVIYYRVDASGAITVRRPVEVNALTMMHDFALTATHIIFMDLPVVFDLDLVRANRLDIPFRWNENYGARLGVLKRDDPFGEIRWFAVDPCYVLHVANAYDTVDGKGIELQVVRYPEMWRNNTAFDQPSFLWNWSIDLVHRTVAERQLDDHVVEFPRVDDRLVGLPARYSVTTADDCLVRNDLITGAAEEHIFGTSASRGHPGEAVFVPAGSGDADEANGYYLSYVYDPARNGSDLVILDASDFSGDVVARIQMPRRVPDGFHSSWIGS